MAPAGDADHDPKPPRAKEKAEAGDKGVAAARRPTDLTEDPKPRPAGQERAPPEPSRTYSSPSRQAWGGVAPEAPRPRPSPHSGAVRRASEGLRERGGGKGAVVSRAGSLAAGSERSGRFLFPPRSPQSPAPRFGWWPLPPPLPPPPPPPSSPSSRRPHCGSFQGRQQPKPERQAEAAQGLSFRPRSPRPSSRPDAGHQVCGGGRRVSTGDHPPAAAAWPRPPGLRGADSAGPALAAPYGSWSLALGGGRESKLSPHPPHPQA